MHVQPLEIVHICEIQYFFRRNAVYFLGEKTSWLLNSLAIKVSGTDDK